MNDNETIEDKLEDFYYAFFEQCGGDVTLDIVKKLLVPPDLRDSNAIILHEAIWNTVRDGEDAILVAVVAVLLSRAIYMDGLETEEKRTCLGELRRLSEANAGNAEIVLRYSKGLVNIQHDDGERYDDYIAELFRLLSDMEFARYVAEEEPGIITYTRRELIDYGQRKGMVAYIKIPGVNVDERVDSPSAW